jgi:desulfoferrodoxin-like iron-binding protein
MPVQEIGERYKCNACGNEVEVVNVGGGNLVCCGLEMVSLDED